MEKIYEKCINRYHTKSGGEMCQAFFEHIKNKRNSLLCGRKMISKKSLELIDTIEMVKKGEGIDIPVENEREVHNIRSWITNNRKRLRPDLRDVRTSYKKEKNLLYIYLE